jgi:hypothetical protein
MRLTSAVVRRVKVCRRGGEQGAVTAETAFVLPSVVLIAILLITGIGWAAQLVRCQDAAGAVARAIARGEDRQAVQALADRVCPDGAELRIVDAGTPDLITVEVVWQADRPILTVLPRIQARASADSVLIGAVS